ncbi:hypothetical protein RJ639_016717 [Escallonia herrerae]|uniref:Uncharacterized protein n=1 Tax=Escallonia herrerae TaxID=1293975 RepID=A0AA89ALJ2_9ASTE|nr:hypothetical protein RJ639_016717 [Escallonia herrerae]
MDRSAEKRTIAVSTAALGPLPPDGTRVRPRLIQSTLFPHRSPDNAVKEDEYYDEDKDDEEEEDYCGSQNKTRRKSRKRKPKAVAQLRASRKLKPMLVLALWHFFWGSSIYVAATGEETLSPKIGDEDSPLTVKSDFLSTISEKRQQKLKQEQPSVGSAEEINQRCSPPDCAAISTIIGTVHSNYNFKSDTFLEDAKKPRQVKRKPNATPDKGRLNTTPRKNAMNCRRNESCSAQLSANSTQSEYTPQSLPNLRLEAKMTAEENSRLFSGRQIHPFFSSWKAGKRSQEAADVDRWCSIERKEKSLNFNPIHDDALSLDWGNWIFSERTFDSSTCGVESVCPPIYDGRVKSLQLDNFLNLSHSSAASLWQNEGSSVQCPIQLETVSLDPFTMQQSSKPLVDEQLAHCERIMDIEVASDIERQGRFLKERMTLYYQSCDNQPANSLWTNKYRPEKAIEICGNSKSVKFLSEWLHFWHEKGVRTSQFSDNVKRGILLDADYNFERSDSDSEDVNGETVLKNVLLVTGPVGYYYENLFTVKKKLTCHRHMKRHDPKDTEWDSALCVQRIQYISYAGDIKSRIIAQDLTYRIQTLIITMCLDYGHVLSGKSAAIYACAKEQGFQVIEITSTTLKIGNKQLLKSSPGKCTLSVPQGSDNEVIELIPLYDNDNSQNASTMPWKSSSEDNITASAQGDIKTVILFEDVDTTLYEDRGFIATIKQLAETAKRPMILTSNSSNPVLPNNLDRVEVCFTVPPSEELLRLVHMVCAAEKIHPCLVEQFISRSQGDIRKTIMHLQFWCQGQSSKKDSGVQSDSRVQRVYGPVGFDLDAGHCILPNIFPSGYPSQLSEIVEKEITKALLMEESSRLLKMVEEEEQNNSDLGMHDEPEMEEAKKEEILSRHCFDQDGNEFAADFRTIYEVFDVSGSPIAFARRNVRRRSDTVLFSDSEDECMGGGVPVVHGELFQDLNNEVQPELSNKSSSHCRETDRCLQPELLLHSEGEKLEESCYHFFETTESLHANAPCLSADVSCVQDSLFIPETDMNDGIVPPSGTVSCCHVDDNAEAAFTNKKFLPNMLPAENNNFDQSIAGFQKIPEALESTFDVVYREVVGDSHFQRVEAVPREYQVLDECSLMDFSRRSNRMDASWSSEVTDVVQETWRKLRLCRMDLQQQASLREKDAFRIVELAYKMTHLISEADLLLADCQPLICVSIFYNFDLD